MFHGKDEFLLPAAPDPSDFHLPAPGAAGHQGALAIPGRDQDMVAAYTFELAVVLMPLFLLDGGFCDQWLALYRSRHDRPFFPQELPGLTAALCHWLRLSS